MYVSCLQLEVKKCEKEKNIQKALKMSESAVEKGAEIIVLPEVFSTGFCYSRFDELSEKSPYPTLKLLRDFSKEYKVIIIGSILEKQNNSYYNLGFCLESGDLIGTYRKTHPFGEEKQYFSSGNSIHVFKTSMVKIGLQICYEIRFPELARILALMKSDLLVTIAEFPYPREDHWRVLAVARAIENQIPHIACNCVSAEFFGASMIIDAFGKIVAEAGSGEEIIIGNIDLTQKNEFRNAITCFEDRRPDLYNQYLHNIDHNEIRRTSKENISSL